MVVAGDYNWSAYCDWTGIRRGLSRGIGPRLGSGGIIGVELAVVDVQGAGFGFIGIGFCSHIHSLRTEELNLSDNVA